MKNKFLTIIIFTSLACAITVIAVILIKLGSTPKQDDPQSQTQYLQIISTSPNPLDEATILPSQTIEFTFNKPIFRSEFKHKFDPEIEHEIETVNGIDKEQGKTLRIVFEKPLEFGSGYTLFVEQNTHSEDGQKLEREYQYHFKTIKYSGI